MEEYTHFFNQVPEQEKCLGSPKASEDKKLELRLGPPGDFFSFKNITTASGIKRLLDQDRFEAKTGDGNWFSHSHEKQCKKLSGHEGSGEMVFSSPWSSSSSGSLHSSSFQREIQREKIQPKPSYLQCSTVVELQCPVKKPSSGPASASFPATTAAGTSNKRFAPAPVVGWPPIRSFRKNLASTSSRSSKMVVDDLPNKTPSEGCTKKPGNFRNDLFVKINMEGIPIGRKINLNAYDSYEKLSVAIDELFRGLLAVLAQREHSAARNGNKAKVDEAKANAGSSSGAGTGTGEYTLVYDDSEGDRILVGDVPWHMFVSTAKRLRVLKALNFPHNDLTTESNKLRTPHRSLFEIEDDEALSGE
ncbi:auxin-responsive protein IAA18 isoform X2 [Hevea brasiliensis]|uniref:auxin-responsive protein IAA18 isoform X2 n=1 Tax=Hevea brasiliensis TaxID=3981 RepID=UPI0025F6815B|nr:auxin-responsive protein IAA18 isoform X2 [Hevea brasiliensis]